MVNDNPINVENVERVIAPAAHEPVNDTWTVRLVVLMLGAFALGVLIAETILRTMEKTLPDQMQTLGGVAIGGLAGLLASTASKRQS